MKKKILIIIAVLIVISLPVYVLIKRNMDTSAAKIVKDYPSSDMEMGKINDQDNISINNLIQDFSDSSKSKKKEAVLGFFSIEEYVNNFVSTLGEQPTKNKRKDEIAKKFQLYKLGFSLTEEILNNPSTIDFTDKSIKKLNLTNLNIKRIDTPDVTKSQTYLKMMNKRCQQYNAKNMTYKTVLYELNGNTYYCGFTLINYDKKWKILDLTCGIVPVDCNVVTSPCTEEVYLQILKEQ